MTDQHRLEQPPYTHAGSKDLTSRVPLLSPKLVIGFLLLVFAIDGGLVEAWRRGFGTRLAHEHGFIEDVQLALIALTFVLFWLGWRQGRGAEGTAAGALAMLTAAIFVRELDVKTLGGPEWYRWISHRGLQEILLVGMTLPILIYLVRRRSQWRGLLDLAVRPRALLLYIAGLLLIVSVYLDRRVVGWQDKIFWEELIELDGYLFLVMAAFTHWKLVHAGTCVNATDRDT